MQLLAPSQFIHTHTHTHARTHKWPRKIKLVPFVRPLHEEASPRHGSPGRDQRRFVGHLGHLHRHHSFQLPPPPPPPQQQQLSYNLCSTSFNSFLRSLGGHALTHSLTHSTSKLSFKAAWIFVGHNSFQMRRNRRMVKINLQTYMECLPSSEISNHRTSKLSSRWLPITWIQMRARDS